MNDRIEEIMIEVNEMNLSIF